MVKKATLFAFFTFSIFAFACEDCKKFIQEISKVDKAIHRLETILHANEEFIAGLDPSDESELIKARSNVSIAKKRIIAAQNQKLELSSKTETPECKQCLHGEKI